MSATKRKRFAKFSGPPYTKYANASVTMALATVEHAVSSASGTASPANAKNGMFNPIHASRNASNPSGHAERPRRRRTRTQRVVERSPMSSIVHGCEARTGSNPSGSVSTAVRNASTSVSTLVMYQITSWPSSTRRGDAPRACRDRAGCSRRTSCRRPPRTRGSNSCGSSTNRYEPV